MNRLLSVLIFALFLVSFNTVAGVAENLPGDRCRLHDPYHERTNCRGNWNFKSPEGKYFGNYIGGWKNGKFHGPGKWVGSNGKVIKANWNQGVARRSEDPEVFYCPLDFSYCSVIFNEKLNVILGISKDIPKPEPEPIVVKPASYSNFDKKIALVIGNSKYLNTVQLLNPQKDAKAVADKLTQMGFEVNLALDLNDQDMATLAKNKVSIVHNPSSNMKLGSGIADASKMIKQNLNISLGTDSSASNNRLDIMEEMRLAALLIKGKNKSPELLSATQAIKMATINGAKALGLESIIGSIEKNKIADLVAIDLNSIENQPIYNPLSTLVYSSSKSDVSYVWINGKVKLKEKKLVNVDEEKIMQTAKIWQTKIKEM